MSRRQYSQTCELLSPAFTVAVAYRLQWLSWGNHRALISKLLQTSKQQAERQLCVSSCCCLTPISAVTVLSEACCTTLSAHCHDVAAHQGLLVLSPLLICYTQKCVLAVASRSLHSASACKYVAADQGLLVLAPLPICSVTGVLALTVAPFLLHSASAQTNTALRNKSCSCEPHTHTCVVKMSSGCCAKFAAHCVSTNP